MTDPHLSSGLVPILAAEAERRVFSGTLAGAFQAWESVPRGRRGSLKTLWIVTVAEDHPAPDFEGKLTPLARSVVAAVLAVLDRTGGPNRCG